MKGGDLNGVAKDDAVKGLALALKDRLHLHTYCFIVTQATYFDRKYIQKSWAKT